ncbi:MAG: hypothetical protein IJ015_02320 [Ruminococcus sp.]|nr:hypothetical protein [Ruminococcus sp.]
MKVFKSILNTLINILIVLVLVVSILVATLALTSKSSGISNIFGYTFQVVMSDSMDGGSEDYEGGDFKKGDVIIGKVTNNAKSDTPETYVIGDIITYKGYLQNNEHLGEQLICHRIVGVQDRDGEPVYQTQGDNRSICTVPDQEVVADYINANAIVAKFHTNDFDGIKIAGVGKAYEFINSQLGFFLCILLPMIFFFLYVLIKVVINFVEYKKAKEDEEKEKNTPSSEPAPQMSAEEYEQFKQFMALKNAQASDSDAPSEEEV